MARFSADATGRFLRSRPRRSQRTCIVVWHGACDPDPLPHLFCKSMIPRGFKSNNLQEYHRKAVIFEFPQEYQSRIFKPRFSGNSALPGGEQLHPSQGRVIANLGAETSGKTGQNAGAALLCASYMQCYRGGKPRSTGCSVHNKNRCGKARAPRVWALCYLAETRCALRRQRKMPTSFRNPMRPIRFAVRKMEAPRTLK